MPGPLQAAFRKRLRKAHGGPYLSIKDEPPVRPTTPRLGTKPKPPVKKRDNQRTYIKPGTQAPPGTRVQEGPRGGRYYEPRGRQGASQALEQAKRDWRGGNAYIDNRGNYRIKREGSSSGPIAPWNKEVKQHFLDVTEFHYEAQGKPIPDAVRDSPSPRYQQGAGQAVHAGKIHHELAAIFKGEGEGAGFMQNAPRPGFNVNISGDRRDIGRRFEQLEDVDGVWEGEREKAWMANYPQQTNPRQVLQTAAAAGLANDQDAVFVRFDGPNAPSAAWDKGEAFTLQTPLGIIDMVNPSAKNLKAAVKMARRFGGGQYVTRPVWTRLLERGKHY